MANAKLTLRCRLAASTLGCGLLLGGCSSFKEGAPEPVVVTSFPAGASVSIDGQQRGITPLVVDLPRAVTHRVTLSKSGYRDSVVTLAPAPNENAANTVKFGLLADQGYYLNLAPNPVEVELSSEILPTSEGVDAFAELGRRVIEADTRLQRGELSAEEHKVIVDGLLRFYDGGNEGTE